VWQAKANACRYKWREIVITKALMSRAELELAVRAELVDLAPSTWHARVAADYILRVVDEYVQTEQERQERRQRDVVEFFLVDGSDGGGSEGWQVAKWLAAEWHRAACHSADHVHEETPWSDALNL
jgi:hypothetical protein